MKYTMTAKGCAIQIDAETGIISGNTYGAQSTIKEEFKAKWDKDAKVWVADTALLTKLLTNGTRAYLERAFGLKEIAEPTEITNIGKLVTKTTGNKPCPRCGTYCYGDCTLNAPSKLGSKDRW